MIPRKNTEYYGSSVSGASINAFADLPKDAFPARVKRIRVSKSSFRPVAQPKARGILWWPSFLLHVRAKYECAFERCMAQAFLATAIVLTLCSEHGWSISIRLNTYSSLQHYD